MEGEEGGFCPRTLSRFGIAEEPGGETKTPPRAGKGHGAGGDP